MEFHRYISSIKEEFSLTTKIQKYGFFAEFILGLLLFASRFIFSKIYQYFPKDIPKKLSLPYPTVFFSNHVAETDITGLSKVHSNFKKPRIKYTIPVREDLIGKNFLVKEFRPKGILKYILHLIDLTKLLPKVFKIVGAVPVKRPFRDDARKLMKEGSLRDQVDRDWKIFAEKIEEGKNAMIFPEGAFSEDGYLRQMKNGIAYLISKKTDLNFFYFTFTYDYLSYKKPAIHIAFGEMFKFPSTMQKDEIALDVKNRLGKLFTVTPANLTSFVILNSSQFIGKTKEWVKDFIHQSATAINSLGGINVSHSLLEGKDGKLIDKILGMMIQKKVIALSNAGELELGTQYENEKSGLKIRNLRKDRPFFYHKNQLRFYDSVLIDLIQKTKAQTV